MTWLSGLYFISIASLVFCVIGLILSGIILIARKFLVKIHPCKLKINDDDALTKTVDSGRTLLSSLLDSGIPIPSPCGGKATCKQCKVKIVKDADQPLETDRATFFQTTVRTRLASFLSNQGPTRHVFGNRRTLFTCFFLGRYGSF